MASPLRVGYAFPPKKLNKQRIAGFVEYAGSRGIEMVSIDLDGDLALQGPFDVILHKLTDQMVAEDERSRRQLANVQMYVKAHPGTRVLDPLDAVRALTDRFSTTAVLQAAASQSGAFLVPQSICVNTEEELAACAPQLSFPVILKSRPACGSPASHVVHCIPSREALRWPGHPVLVQQLVRHEPPVMWKAYVIAGHVHLTPRTSIEVGAVSGQQAPASLDTTRLSKEYAEAPPLAPEDRARIERACAALCDQLGLSLFGFDVIFESVTGRLFVVDVNYFPAYDGIEEFFPSLYKLVVDTAAHRLA